MLKFINEQIAAGCLPVSYIRLPAVFGNECDFRWKQYHNSKLEYIKVAYNVGDEEHCEIQAVLLYHWMTAGISATAF
jgi:hypothetical protein